MNDDILRALSANIIRLRRARGLTQEDLAGLVEMDRSYLSEIESGKKNPSLAMLERIRAALRCNFDDLLKT